METASRSSVSHAMETQLSTSFVPDGKAKRSWQWRCGYRMEIQLTAFQWPEPGGSVAGGLSARKTEVQDGIHRPRRSSTYRFADATTLSPLRTLAESCLGPGERT